MKKITLFLAVIFFARAACPLFAQVEGLTGTISKSSPNYQDKIDLTIQCNVTEGLESFDFQYVIKDPSNVTKYDEKYHYDTIETGIFTHTMSNISVSDFFSAYGTYKFTPIVSDVGEPLAPPGPDVSFTIKPDATAHSIAVSDPAPKYPGGSINLSAGCSVDSIFSGTEFRFDFIIKDKDGTEKYTNSKTVTQGSSGNLSSSVTGLGVTQFFSTYGKYSYVSKIYRGAEPLSTESADFTIEPPTDDIIRLIAPGNRAAIYDSLPQFQWRSIIAEGAGVSSYRVSVCEDNSFASSKIRWIGTTDNTTLRYNNGIPPRDPRSVLAYDREYYWRVEALDRSGGRIKEPSVVRSFILKTRAVHRALHDLAILRVGIEPKIAVKGLPLKVKAYVGNLGDSTEKSVQVKLYINNSFIESKFLRDVAPVPERAAPARDTAAPVSKAVVDGRTPFVEFRWTPARDMAEKTLVVKTVAEGVTDRDPGNNKNVTKIRLEAPGQEEIKLELPDMRLYLGMFKKNIEVRCRFTSPYDVSGAKITHYTWRWTKEAVFGKKRIAATDGEKVVSWTLPGEYKVPVDILWMKFVAGKKPELHLDFFGVNSRGKSIHLAGHLEARPTVLPTKPDGSKLTKEEIRNAFNLFAEEVERELKEKGFLPEDREELNKFKKIMSDIFVPVISQNIYEKRLKELEKLAGKIKETLIYRRSMQSKNDSIQSFIDRIREAHGRLAPDREEKEKFEEIKSLFRGLAGLALKEAERQYRKLDKAMESLAKMRESSRERDARKERVRKFLDDNRGMASAAIFSIQEKNKYSEIEGFFKGLAGLLRKEVDIKLRKMERLMDDLNKLAKDRKENDRRKKDISDFINKVKEEHKKIAADAEEKLKLSEIEKLFREIGKELTGSVKRKIEKTEKAIQKLKEFRKEIKAFVEKKAKAEKSFQEIKGQVAESMLTGTEQNKYNDIKKLFSDLDSISSSRQSARESKLKSIENKVNDLKSIKSVISGRESRKSAMERFVSQTESEFRSRPPYDDKIKKDFDKIKSKLNDFKRGKKFEESKLKTIENLKGSLQKVLSGMKAKQKDKDNIKRSMESLKSSIRSFEQKVRSYSRKVKKSEVSKIDSVIKNVEKEIKNKDLKKDKELKDIMSEINKMFRKAK
jgi:hypothetical protein